MERGVVFVDDVQLPGPERAARLCVANLGWTIKGQGKEGAHEWVVARTGSRDAFLRPYTELIGFLAMSLRDGGEVKRRRRDQGPEVVEPVEMTGRNKQRMARMIEMFNSGDLTGVDPVIDVNYIDHQSGEGRGPVVFRQVVESARRFSPPQRGD